MNFLVQEPQNWSFQTKKMVAIMKIVNFFEDFGFMIKGATGKIKNNAKKL